MGLMLDLTKSPKLQVRSYEQGNDQTYEEQTEIYGSTKYYVIRHMI